VVPSHLAQLSASQRSVFDQQPIEVAALADACSRAFALTGDERWAVVWTELWAGFWATTIAEWRFTTRTRAVALRR
jgi:hypothetical protein